MRFVLRSAAPLLALLFALSASAEEKTAVGIDYLNEKVVVLEQATLETQLAYPAKITVSGVIREAYAGPYVALIRPDGKALEITDFDQEQLRFSIPLRFTKGKGIYRLDITGTRAGGRTHTGARLRFFCGVDPSAEKPRPKDEATDPRLSTDILETRLFADINARRKAAGVDPVPWLEPLAVLAREHAAACAKAGKLDHRLGEDGHLAEQAKDRYVWDPIKYTRPRKRPSKDPAQASHIAVLLGARKGLATLGHDWGIKAAMALPMTSEVMTHAACGIARDKSDRLYVVFAFAQLNGRAIPADVKRREQVVLQQARRASGDDALVRLMALARWRTQKSTALFKKAAQSRDPARKAVGFDGWLLADEVAARKSLERQLGECEAHLAAARRPEEILSRTAWLLRLQHAPDLVDRAQVLETGARALAEKAAADADK